MIAFYWKLESFFFFCFDGLRLSLISLTYLKSFMELGIMEEINNDVL